MKTYDAACGRKKGSSRLAARWYEFRADAPFRREARQSRLAARMYELVVEN